MVQALFRAHGHDRPLAGAHAVHAPERRRRPPEHHARQVIPGEDRVFLGGPRRDDHSRRVHVHQLAVPGEWHVQTLVHPEGGDVLEHGHRVERPHLGLERALAIENRPRRDPFADPALVAHEHRGAPALTASRAASRPAMPAPITSTSTCS